MINQAGVFRDIENMSIEVVSHGPRKGLPLALKVQPSLIAKIKLSQKGDTKLKRLRQIVVQGKSLGFMIYENGISRLPNQLFVPNQEELKGNILEECSLFSVLGRNKKG